MRGPLDTSDFEFERRKINIRALREARVGLGVEDYRTLEVCKEMLGKTGGLITRYLLKFTLRTANVFVIMWNWLKALLKVFVGRVLY